jgi:hypothetical protein
MDFDRMPIMGATCETRAAYSSRALEFTLWIFMILKIAFKAIILNEQENDLNA